MTNKKKIQKMFDIFFELKHHKNTPDVIHFLYQKIYHHDTGVVFAGVGKNFWLAEKVAATYKSIGVVATSMCPTHAIHGDLGYIYDQVIIVMSKSGTTPELQRFIKYITCLKQNEPDGLGRFNPSLIGIFLNNKYEDKNKDFEYLITPKSSEIYEFDSQNMIPTLSINILQMYIDYIGVALFEMMPGAKQRFKYHHPAGNIGASLGTKELIK